MVASSLRVGLRAGLRAGFASAKANEASAKANEASAKLQEADGVSGGVVALLSSAGQLEALASTSAIGGDG